MQEGLPDRLKELRKRLGKTQKEMAVIIGVSQSTYEKYERGQITPKSTRLSKIAAKLNVSIDVLMGNDKKKYLLVEGLKGHQLEAVEKVIESFQKSNKNQ